MQTSDKGIALIKEFEGCKLTAYQDSIGVWTIGYGWTQPVDGKPIRAGMTIKQETAERLLKPDWSATKATCPAWLRSD
jgi:GH24 family phage-related lysozyme (muramidase)